MFERTSVLTTWQTGRFCTGGTGAVNAVGSKLYHTVAYSRGEVAVLVGLIGTDKTSDMRTRLDRALVTGVYTAAVVKMKHQSKPEKYCIYWCKCRRFITILTASICLPQS